MAHTVAPLLLVGPPGTGKTSWCYSLAAAHGLRVEYLSLATRDPAEVVGAAAPDLALGVVRWLDAESVMRAREEPTLVVLDELTAAHPVQRTPALRWADDSAQLHPRSRVIATANPPEYAAGAAAPLTEPEISRFRVRHWGAERAVAWMSGDRSVPAAGCEPEPGEVERTLALVSAYLGRRPEAAMAAAEAMRAAVARMQPYPCPRAWTRAASEAARDGDDAWAECIGAESACAWLSWRDAQDLPDPADVLAGREVQIPTRQDSVYAAAVCVAAAAAAEGVTLDQGRAALDWIAEAAAKRKCAALLARAAGRVLRAHPALVAEHSATGGAPAVFARVVVAEAEEAAS